MTTELSEPMTDPFPELDALVERRKTRAAELAAEAERRALASTPATPAVPEQQRERIICGKCEQPFDSVVFFVAGRPAIRKLYCDPCVFAHEDSLAAREGRTIPDRWAAVCEPEFRTVDEGGATVFARLERECPKLAEVTGWTYGAGGLLVRGATGRCKTRAVWRLLRAQFDLGKRIFATTAGRFAREFADAAGNHRQMEWFTPMVDADIFFLDDLGKKPWTPNVWAEFFELLDERAKHHRPFIITTNEDRESLRVKCADPVTWDPLIRRMTENTRSIVL